MQITIPNKVSKPKASCPANVKHDELVRLMMQSLLDLGYPEAATALTQESGVSLESDLIIRFRSSLLEGQWTTAEQLLHQLPSLPQHLPKMQFLIRQQKYLELLEKGETMQALHVLRSEITPLGQNIERLHLLTSLVLCSCLEDVKAQATWEGTEEGRQHLLTQLQHNPLPTPPKYLDYVDPSAMIPNHRLCHLIDQSLQWQKGACLYHNPRQDESFSLFSDHLCDKSLFPTKTVNVLSGHTDEIWHVAYSHSGLYLASVSKDKTCIIWDMKTGEQIQSFCSPVSGSYCAWSPDDSKLLVCGTDFLLRLWDPTHGHLLGTYKHHNDQVTGCVWLPDNRHFISGACDKELCLWDLTEDSKPIMRWPVPRTTDMKMTEDGKRLVTIGIDKCITLYNIDTIHMTELGRIQESGVITSLALTRDGQFALVNVQDCQELHLWDLNKLELVHRYSGQKQHTYIIRSTLGGHHESFVLSGSEDNRVYVWSRENEALLEVLEGHTDTVNCVSWCPIEPMQFVSASDDHTIRVWGSNQV